MLLLATAQAHSLADVSHLPWWAQFAIGVGLCAVACCFGWLSSRSDSCLPGAAAFIIGLAGLGTLWGALFGP